MSGASSVVVRRVELCYALFGAEASQPAKASLTSLQGRMGVCASPASIRCAICGLLWRPGGRLRPVFPECPECLWKKVASPQFRSSNRGAAWSRMIQRALDEAEGDAERVALARGLRGNVWSAMRCPHANYVVQKMIAVMRPPSLLFILDELLAENELAVQRAARNPYACRILQRLLEHWPQRHLRGVVENLLVDAVRLSVHRFANYVVRRMAESATDDDCARLTLILAAEAHFVGARDSGSAVLAEILKRQPWGKEQHELARSLLATDGLVAKMAQQRQGHRAVLAMREVFQWHSAEYDSLHAQLRAYKEVLRSTRYGRMVMSSFGARAARPVVVPRRPLNVGEEEG